MSLLEALAEAVVGVSASKGGGNLVERDGGLDSLFGSAKPKPSQGGGLEDVLGAILGGGQQGGGAASSGGAQGGLGGLLEQLAGGSQSGGGSGPGLEDLIGQLTGGGAGGQSGGLGELIGAVTGALGGSAPAGGGAPQGGGGGSFGEVLNTAITNRGKKTDEKPKTSAAQEAAAGLMLRAMLQAAKSDGKFDQAEQEKLLARLKDASPAEKQFVQAEMRSPVDVQGLAREVPKGLEQQVYMMSVLGIDLDSQEEAQYLHQLAQAMDLNKDTVNFIHSRVGAPAIYR